MPDNSWRGIYLKLRAMLFRLSRISHWTQHMKIDFRYQIKVRPTLIAIRCPQCSSNALLHSPPADILEQIGKTDFYRVRESGKRITGEIAGRMTCTRCGLSKDGSITWPSAAYYQFRIGTGTVWAWNREYLLLLRDWIAADSRDENMLWSTKRFPDARVRFPYAHFLANLPRYILLKRNRAAIVKKADDLLRRQ